MSQLESAPSYNEHVAPLLSSVGQCPGGYLDERVPPRHSVCAVPLVGTYEHQGPALRGAAAARTEAGVVAASGHARVAAACDTTKQKAPEFDSRRGAPSCV
ncbi:unnamed protein product [Lampetra fluviatilis]